MARSEPPWESAVDMVVIGKSPSAKMIVLGMFLLGTGGGVMAVGDALSNEITVLVGFLLLCW